MEAKPTYVLLSISDKIGVKESLNEEINKEIKNYLEQDTDCRLVSTISVVLDANTINELTNADGLFLITGAYGIFQIEVIKGGQRNYISIPKDELFDYSLTGICWGENVYGKPVIATFNDNGKCPDGTEMDAKKINKLHSFLKL